MIKIDLTLSRAGIGGLEGKSDAEHIVEWIKASIAAVTENGAEAMTHLALRRCVSKFEALSPEAVEVSLDDIDAHFIRWALLSSRFPGNSNKIACQILAKFGISL